MPPLQRRDIGPGEEFDVFRFVHTTDPQGQGFLDQFRSDAARGRPPLGRREEQIPALRDGLSVFRTADHARGVFRSIAAKVGAGNVRMGRFLARVRLVGGRGVSVEDLGEVDGHMTVWGDPAVLASMVVDYEDAN